MKPKVVSLRTSIKFVKFLAKLFRKKDRIHNSLVPGMREVELLTIEKDNKGILYKKNFMPIHSTT